MRTMIVLALLLIGITTIFAEDNNDLFDIKPGWYNENKGDC